MMDPNTHDQGRLLHETTALANLVKFKREVHKYSDAY